MYVLFLVLNSGGYDGWNIFFIVLRITLFVNSFRTCIFIGIIISLKVMFLEFEEEVFEMKEN